MPAAARGAIPELPLPGTLTGKEVPSVDHVTSQASRSPASRADRHAWAEPGVEDLGGGVYRIPLPLPGDALKAVNVYAIAGDDGVDLFDAGMALAQARERLTGALGQLGFGLGDIRNFFITHIHQDHYTLAVELRTTLRGQITLGEGERINMAAIRDVAAGRNEPGFIEMLPAMGAADLAEQVRRLMRPRLAGPQPRLQWSDPDHWLADGAVLDLRSRTLRAIHTPGHTRGHVVFHDEAGAALFAGDHVLPHITPSIGFEAVPSGSRCRTSSGHCGWSAACPTCGCCPPTGRWPPAPTPGSMNCWPIMTTGSPAAWRRSGTARPPPTRPLASCGGPAGSAGWASWTRSTRCWR